MTKRSVLFSAAIICLAPFVARAQSPDPAVIHTCKVLEVAYTAAIGSAVPAYPLDIRPSHRSLDLGSIVKEYQEKLALEPSEFEDLKSKQTAYKVDGFRPLCVPTAKPAQRSDKEGHVQFTSFTSQIFSSDGRLAVVEVSFHELGFGYGMMCIARRTSATWVAHCHGSWIT
jgi:hypothetical protein